MHSTHTHRFSSWRIVWVPVDDKQAGVVDRAGSVLLARGLRWLAERAPETPMVAARPLQQLVSEGECLRSVLPRLKWLSMAPDGSRWLPTT